MINNFYEELSKKFRVNVSTSHDFYYELLFNSKNEINNLVDLGCGNGDFLKYLKKRKPNLDFYGVDSNDLKFDTKNGKDIKYYHEDILNFLKKEKKGTYDVVTLFHVVEHLPIDYLLQVIVEVYKVLKPEGLMIIETPNIENYEVLSRSFYLDPSHLRPMPKALLEFIAEFTKFNKINCISINDKAINLNDILINDIFVHQGADLALFAQKKGTLSGNFSNFFNISPQDRYDNTGLMKIYSSQQQAHLKTFSNFASSINSQLENEIKQLQTQIDKLKGEINDEINDLTNFHTRILNALEKIRSIKNKVRIFFMRIKNTFSKMKINNKNDRNLSLIEKEFLDKLK